MGRQRDPRDSTAIRHHYDTERALAAQLMATPADRRAVAYGEVYDALFTAIPDHPQLVIGADERAQKIEQKLQLVGRFLDPGTVLVEMGAGDCAFYATAGPKVKQVYAIDVSEEIVRNAPALPNGEVLLSDGVHVPLDDGAADVVFSDQLMEHLHPDDALAQLSEIHRILHDGGRYVFSTPSRHTGPHDVSRAFDDVATGFHLKEYDHRLLRKLLVGAGFRSVQFYAGGRGHYVKAPYALLRAAEWCFDRLPSGLRRRVRDSTPAMALFGVNAVATA